MEQARELDIKDYIQLPFTVADPFSVAIRSSQMAMILTNPRLPDNPIVFANDAFLKNTGYSRSEVLGRNCRFLQGPGTQKAAVTRIRDALRDRQQISVEILNYRKDGSEFWNGLNISPVFDDEGRLDYFFAAQLDVSARIERQNESELQEIAQVKRNAELEKAMQTQQVLLHEIDHRVKNSLQMVSAMLMLQAMSIPDSRLQRTLGEMLERVDAIGLAHQRLYELSQPTRFNLEDFVREIVANVIGASGRKDIQVAMRLAPAVVGAGSAAALALVLNEALTNAVKHGFKDGRAGRLTVDLSAGGGRCSVAIADDGPGLPNFDADQKSFGTTLIETLVRQMGATLEWRSTNPGTLFRIDFPIGEG